MPRLAAAGTKWHATVGELKDWASAAAINKQAMDFLVARHAPLVGGDLSHLMHSFGGRNEIDGSVINGHGDPEWATYARIMQRALWEQAKANPRTADIPVAGPSNPDRLRRPESSRARRPEPVVGVGQRPSLQQGHQPKPRDRPAPERPAPGVSREKPLHLHRDRLQQLAAGQSRRDGRGGGLRDVLGARNMRLLPAATRSTDGSSCSTTPTGSTTPVRRRSTALPTVRRTSGWWR